MVAGLNDKKFSWHQLLDLEFAWPGRDDGQGEGLCQMRPASWLSNRRQRTSVPALDEEQDLAWIESTEQVRLLMRVKQVLKDCALMLDAQPIQNPEGRVIMYLTRMRCGDSAHYARPIHSADRGVKPQPTF